MVKEYNFYSLSMLSGKLATRPIYIYILQDALATVYEETGDQRYFDFLCVISLAEKKQKHLTWQIT